MSEEIIGAYPKYNKFILYSSKKGKVIEKEVVSEKAMTLEEALKYYKVTGVKGVE